MRFKTNLARWLAVVGFAAARAWVESAVVLYRRTLMGRLEPHQPTPLPEVGGLAFAELARDAATLARPALVDGSFGIAGLIPSGLGLLWTRGLAAAGR